MQKFVFEFVLAKLEDFKNKRPRVDQSTISVNNSWVCWIELRMMRNQAKGRATIDEVVDIGVTVLQMNEEGPGQ